MQIVHDTDPKQRNAININRNRGGSRKEKKMSAITKTVLTAVLVALGLTLTVGAAEPAKSDSPPGAVVGTNRVWLASDYSCHQIAIYREGQGIVWKHKTSGVYDVCARPNGNIVWADYGGIHEIAPDRQKGEGGKVLWTYACGSAEPKFAGKAEVHSCEVQPDGTVVTVEAGSRRLVILDPTGKVVGTAPVASAEKSVHLQFRLVRRGADGTQWVACLAEGLVKEVTTAGVVKRILAVPAAKAGNCRIYEALPLPDGHVLLSAAGLCRAIECDATGNVVWEFNNADAKAAGFQMK